MILHVLIAMVAGWINRHQQHVIAYLQEENRVLTAHLGDRRQVERGGPAWNQQEIDGPRDAVHAGRGCAVVALPSRRRRLLSRHRLQ